MQLEIVLDHMYLNISHDPQFNHLSTDNNYQSLVNFGVNVGDPEIWGSFVLSQYNLDLYTTCMACMAVC